jgi:hypothetical protein
MNKLQLREDEIGRKLREALSAATDPQRIQDLQAELSALEISISLRLESLRG